MLVSSNFKLVGDSALERDPLTWFVQSVRRAAKYFKEVISELKVRELGMVRLSRLRVI